MEYEGSFPERFPNGNQGESPFSVGRGEESRQSWSCARELFLPLDLSVLICAMGTVNPTLQGC